MRKIPQLGYVCGFFTGLVITLTTFSGSAEERNKEKASESSSKTATVAPVDELTTQQKELLSLAKEFSTEITQVLEGWISSGTITTERLFSYLYYPVANTDPTKYTTDYDRFADRDFQAILEKYISKSNTILYAIASDRNGYVPTHNRQQSQPLTGNRAMDLVNNRTKRIFGDVVAFHAARNQKPYLFQTYPRDTGEVIGDVSIPIFVRGRHWGSVRIGYKQVDKN
jgi:methyl-accepting chemotaxis protein